MKIKILNRKSYFWQNIIFGSNVPGIIAIHFPTNYNCWESTRKFQIDLKIKCIMKLCTIPITRQPLCATELTLILVSNVSNNVLIRLLLIEKKMYQLDGIPRKSIFKKCPKQCELFLYIFLQLQLTLGQCLDGSLAYFESRLVKPYSNVNFKKIINMNIFKSRHKTFSSFI